MFTSETVMKPANPVKQDNRALFPKPGERFFDKSEKQPSFPGTAANLAIQCKLSVGAPGDAYEKEADAMADNVMRMPQVKKQPRATDASSLQRRGDKDKLQAKGEGVPEVTPAFERELQGSKGGGSPLPGGVQQQMETGIGADFSNVRIHTGAHAAQLSNSIQAQAFTHGSDIYFNEGKYSPGTDSGRHLLAHELTHTVQQGASSAVNRQTSLAPYSNDTVKRTVHAYNTVPGIQLFPILINGKVGDDSERASSTYWDKSVRETIKKQTGYSHSEFKYVDGDKGFWPSTRVKAGKEKGKADAPGIYARLKKTLKDGKITEQLQVISHSRGGAYASGYMQGLTEEIIKLAEKEKIGFAYGKDKIIEYSVNLAPHQSNWIDYKNNGSKNVNISHIGDPLSGDDATGNVINVQSIPEQDAWDQHGNKTYNTELNFILNILEHNTDKSKLMEEIKAGYKKYDNSRTNGDKSVVTKGS